MKKIIATIAAVLCFSGVSFAAGPVIFDVDHTTDIPKFTGTIYYVNAAKADNSKDGLTPDNAKNTIAAAVALMGAGDAVTIKAGNYTSVGLSLPYTGMEMWFEVGVVLAPATGTVLSITGNYCRLKGNHKITVPSGQIGIAVEGDECIIGATGIKVTGSGVVLNDCAVGLPTTTAYDIQGIQARLYRCKTVGNASTYGYKISGSVDTGVLENCTSVGHATSGFYIDTGSDDWTLLNCSSGSGDGKWRDIDTSNVWSGFTYDDVIYVTTTFSGSAIEYSMLTLTGGVRISDVHGHVETVIPGVACTIYLQLYSLGGTEDITDNAGVDIDAAVVGSVLVRSSNATDPLVLANPDGDVQFLENTSFREPKTSFDVVADDTNATIIRLVMSAAQASGAIHWHFKWVPLTEDGFLEVF